MLIDPRSGSASQSLQSRIMAGLVKLSEPELQQLYLLWITFLLLKTRLAKYRIPYWGLTVWILLYFLGVNASGTSSYAAASGKCSPRWQSRVAWY